jgi:xanthine dehydrogenase molybdopterin-binding subunit B
MNDPRLIPGSAVARGGVGEPVRHDSAHLHVAGEAA